MSVNASVKPPTALTFFVLYGSLILAIFNYTLSIMASIYIVSDLGGSTTTTTYSITFFALGNAIGIPLGPWLIGNWGIRRPLVACTLLFVVFSIPATTTNSYEVFLVSRFLQGLVCGPFYAIILSLLNVIMPEKYRALAPSINACIFIATPVLGACWGGWISYEWNWRILYILDIPAALFFAVLQFFKLDGYDELFFKKIKVDGVGYLAFSVALLCLGTVITMGQQLDWFRSNLITCLTVVGTFFSIFFVLWELDTEDPLINLRLLAEPAFAFSVAHLGLLFFLYFGNIILLSLWLNFWARYTPYWINLLLGGTAFSAFIIIFLRAPFNRLDCRIFWSIAVIFFCISAFYTSTFNVVIDFERIAYSRLLAGLGLAFFFPPIFRLCFSLFPTKFLDVLTILQVMRALGSGLGAAIITTIWERRQVFFHQRLVSKLTPLSRMTEEYYHNASLKGLHGETATAQLEYFAQREASSLALDDVFYLMGWLLIGLLLSFILTYFIPKEIFNPGVGGGEVVEAKASSE
jgi:DHA2 family multidrug resistance protein